MTNPSVELEHEVFKLRVALEASERREASLRQLLLQKNAVEDNLRGLVNELQLAMELSRLSTTDPEPALSASQIPAAPVPPAHSPRTQVVHCGTCRCGKSPIAVRKTPPPTSPIPLPDRQIDDDLRLSMKRLRLED
jgi:hypothetical protein